jgi:hypothetical protein
MKAVKFLALLLVVVASASARSFDTIDILCGMSNDPTLCDQVTGEDLFCTDFCNTSCSGDTDITAACNPRAGGGYRCVCHGTPQP